ncbi:MAG: hypothetical protein HYT29_02015 [Parcubacteria group bacterium]|nr:hypothetical protein [Parcubacteria group bacterium]
MHKKELEQKLLEISTQLKALGDLNALVQKSQGLPGVIEDAQVKKARLEAVLNDIPARSEELGRLTGEVKNLNEQVLAREEDAAELTTKTEGLQQKVEKLVDETHDQLGIAANAKLASTFEGVKDEMEQEKEKWFWWLIGAVVVLVVGTGVVVLWQVKEAGTLYHLSFPIRVALLSPLVYLVVFINREYSRVRNLIEEYTFKAAIARSFEAYKEIVQSTDSETDSTSTHRFILESIKSLYSSPMVNIKKNTHKEKENTPDILSGIRSTIKDTLTNENHDQ